MVTQSEKLEGEGAAFVTPRSEASQGEMNPVKGGIPGAWGKAALFTLFLLMLGLSMAFPYGLGLVAFIVIIALAGALCGAGLMCFNLVKDMLGRTTTFGYSPTTAYLTGRKMKRNKKEESAVEEKKEDK
jgi:hypothetical protein